MSLVPFRAGCPARDLLLSSIGTRVAQVVSENADDVQRKLRRAAADGAVGLVHAAVTSSSRKNISIFAPLRVGVDAADADADAGDDAARGGGARRLSRLARWRRRLGEEATLLRWKAKALVKLTLGIWDREGERPRRARAPTDRRRAPCLD